MDIRRTVLLADANEEFRTLVRKIIDETEEFSVVGSVGDGTEALRLAREEAPDLILMDVVLPGLDGFGVLKQLREQEQKYTELIARLSAVEQSAKQAHYRIDEIREHCCGD